MQTNKPPPPPGRPTISQRVSAIQLASRAHSSPKGKMMAHGQAIVLPPAVHSKSSPNNKNKYPNHVLLLDEMDERRICKTKRSRFMRWKNQDKYPRKEAEVQSQTAGMSTGEA
jgi:hypothetical protein